MPKRFIYEQLMADVLTLTATTVQPTRRLRSQRRKSQRKKPSKLDKLKEYFNERDNTFLAALKEMSDKQHSLMEKLNEKL